MWRRGSARLFTALASTSKQASAADALAQACAGSNAPSTTVLVSLSRGFSTSFWDVPGQSARQDLFIEMHTIRSMLPNRSPFTPHFTPHGVMLMPNSNSMQLAVAPAQQQSVADEAEEQHEESGMWADSVKRKRKLKMKKHKLKKRRKLTRHQQ